MLARVLMGMLLQLVIARKLWIGQSIDHSTVDLMVDVFLNGVRS
jgi:hypothetical protein